MWRHLALILSLIYFSNCDPCQPRDFGHSSVVCVCNSSYCDTHDKIVPTSHLTGFVSNRAGSRLERYSVQWRSGNTETVGVTINVTRSVKYQQLFGFGGAFTDAAGINIAKLSPEAQQKLIESYYSDVGSEYNIGRQCVNTQVLFLLKNSQKQWFSRK